MRYTPALVNKEDSTGGVPGARGHLSARRRAALGTGAGLTGEPMSNEATAANQKLIIANQKKILANQRRIEANQAKLDKVLANQKKILARLS
jgi:hypothetical protein